MLVKEKWREEPWFILKGLILNLNIGNVAFASPPTALPRVEEPGESKLQSRQASPARRSCQPCSPSMRRQPANLPKVRNAAGCGEGLTFHKHPKKSLYLHPTNSASFGIPNSLLQGRQELPSCLLHRCSAFAGRLEMKIHVTVTQAIAAAFGS